MNSTTTALTALFDRIPRRHSLDNVKEINSILSEYEDVLIAIESLNAWYESKMPVFFDELENVRSIIRKSIDNKASKKNKDLYFDEASGILKDSMEAVIALYDDGTRTG